jgi:hypothetical protein
VVITEWGLAAEEAGTCDVGHEVAATQGHEQGSGGEVVVTTSTGWDAPQAYEAAADCHEEFGGTGNGEGVPAPRALLADECMKSDCHAEEKGAADGTAVPRTDAGGEAGSGGWGLDAFSSGDGGCDGESIAAVAAAGVALDCAGFCGLDIAALRALCG